MFLYKRRPDLCVVWEEGVKILYSDNFGIFRKMYIFGAMIFFLEGGGGHHEIGLFLGSF